MLELTTKQHEYILEISNSPKTIQELAEIMGISDGNVSKRVAELRAMGLVRSTWKTIDRRHLYIHTLVRSYEDLVSRGFEVVHYNREPITEAEIYYAAILTRGGMTGLQRVEQYQKVFPARTAAALKGILRKARFQHLCR